MNKMKTNKEIIEKYREYRIEVTGVKESTFNHEYFALKGLSKSVNDKPFKQIKEMEIAKFLNKRTPKSKFNCITDLTKFYRWLYGKEKDEKLPDCIRNINKNRRSLMKIYKDESIKYREKVITEEEYQRLIDSAYKLMHKSMIETLYNFGCRASELLSMNGNDVHYNGNVTKITVRRSKTKPREIIYQGRSEYLLKWYESYAPFRDIKNKPLWTNYQKRYKNQRYKISGLIKAVGVISERAGLRRITPHDFRHTAITNARYNGVPDTHIESNFGFEKNTHMMKIYDHNSTKDYEEYLKEKQEEIKPTYELLEKKYRNKEEIQQKEINELKKTLNLVLEVINKSENKMGLSNKILNKQLGIKEKKSNHPEDKL